MKVFISDDQEEQRLWLTDIITAQLDELNFNYELASVWQPDDVLQAVKMTSGPNIYFLDIVLKQATNGIELATKIRDYDPDGFIVYVSVRDDMLPETLSAMTTPTGFISKMDLFNKAKFVPRVREVLTVIKKRLTTLNEAPEPTLSLHSGALLLKLKLTDIVYCEKVHGLRTARIVTEHQAYLVHKNLSTIKEQLGDSRFFNDFQSYALNLDKIVTIDFNKGWITMMNGDRLSFSRGTIKKLRAYYQTQE
ncbi:LytTR family DNA-binding domain-containing protein [Lactiplantibacillus sp. WILCCON 0030]|uniref:LytTR family DNA-binding domain-containing protein n=1 Tax=Lactiplantibacillus brownii TaxID=3069269 RepID=A0ABU1AAR2_9LACO|nr:LytTR family DNA-binding domain-containing protein [Lactiplantibacillus brownii]MDQ7938006.1 LytTR family DNA-binding domain-containing protein [Lactiplantibacillus brownii]